MSVLLPIYRNGKCRAFGPNPGRPPGVCGRNFDRNSGSTAQTLRRGGRRMSAHAAGMGPRPKEFA